MPISTPAAARRRVKSTSSEHLSRMNDAGVERADRQHERADDSMPRVEEQDAKLLHWSVTVLRQQEFSGGSCIHDLHTVACRPCQRPTPQLDGCKNLRRAGLPNPGDSAQVVVSRPDQTVRSVRRFEHRVGHVERAGARASMPEHDREQFVVAQSCSAETVQLLTWSIVQRDGLHRTPYRARLSC